MAVFFFVVVLRNIFLLQCAYHCGLVLEGALARMVHLDLRKSEFANLARLASSRASTSPSATEFSLPIPFCLPVSTHVGGELPDPLLARSQTRDDEWCLAVHREPHPVTKSKTLLLMHDRHHGGNSWAGTEAHRDCAARDMNLVAELKTLNSGGAEQINKGSCRDLIFCCVLSFFSFFG